MISHTFRGIQPQQDKDDDDGDDDDVWHLSAGINNSQTSHSPNVLVLVVCEFGFFFFATVGRCR